MGAKVFSYFECIGLLTQIKSVRAIFVKVEQDRHISSYDIAEALDVDCETVLRHLRMSG